MRMKAWSAGLIAVAILAGCSSSDGGTSETEAEAFDSTATDGSNKTLTVARLESFDGWKLDSAAAYSTYQTHPAVFEPLLRFSSDGASVEPGLAEKWTYDEPTTSWTFNLRTNAAFSNGEPVTSADVVFSYGVWSAGINFGGSFSQIADVVAVDDHTVTFVMKAPDSVLPALLSGSVAGVLPKDYAGMTEDDFYADPIGAGPYTVKEWSTGGRIVLDRNPSYYASDRPYFDEVVIDVVADDSEISRLFESGEIDLVNYVSIASAGQYDESALLVTPSSQISHLSLNATRAPFGDQATRQAVSQAIDYESIVNGPLAGFGTAPTGILPPNLGNWAAPTKPYYQFDAAAATTTLQSSANADGFSTELIYDAGNGTDALLAQVVKDNLAAVGIDVALTGLETLAFLDRAFTNDADMVLWSFGAISPDESDPLGWIGGTGYLFTGMDQTDFDAQRTAYLTTVSATVKQDAIVAIQDEGYEQAAIIALAETPTLHAVAADLKGFAPAPWGLYYFDTISRG